MTEPAIAVAPYGTRLGRKFAQMPLDDLHWPLGRPLHVMQGTVADLTNADHLIVYPRTKMHYQPSFGTRAKVSMMVVEPSVIHGRHLRYLRLSHRRFFRVLSYNEPLLARIPNGLFLAFGTTWVPEYAALDVTKTREMSLIASAKRDQEGHVLRHAIVDSLPDLAVEVDVLGGGYVPFEQKSDGLAPYRYSIVIENTRERNYFSEKLMDAVLCETVPIYWGCPNIGDFMDTGGMVICENAAQIRSAIQAASPEQYATLVPALRATIPQAARWIDLEARAAETLRASL